MTSIFWCNGVPVYSWETWMKQITSWMKEKMWILSCTLFCYTYMYNIYASPLSGMITTEDSMTRAVRCLNKKYFKTLAPCKLHAYANFNHVVVLLRLRYDCASFTSLFACLTNLIYQSILELLKSCGLFIWYPAPFNNMFYYMPYDKIVKTCKTFILRPVQQHVQQHTIW